PAHQEIRPAHHHGEPLRPRALRLQAGALRRALRGATMTSDTIQSERREGGILVLRLNRPEAYNAWTMAMRDRLGALISDAATDPKVRALVLTGAGENAFCAGQDLAETERFADDHNVDEWMRNIRRFYDLVRAMPKPFVGALNGVAAGSGFQIA